MGFSYIMREKDGAAIYGIFHMIVGACSQQKNRNGWLTVNGESAGTPWGVDDLAVKFRRPDAEIARALEILTSEKVGWIIIHKPLLKNDLQIDNIRLTADSPPTHLEGKGREGKGIILVEVEVLEYLNSKTKREFRPTEQNLSFIKSRLGESGVTTDGVKKMIDRQCLRWLGTDQQEYLRPQTLFNKTKFDSYYAAKDLPVKNEINSKPNPRNAGVVGDLAENARRTAEFVSRQQPKPA